jgi:hypothetical protein
MAKQNKSATTSQGGDGEGCLLSGGGGGGSGDRSEPRLRDGAGKGLWRNESAEATTENWIWSGAHSSNSSLED